MPIPFAPIVIAGATAAIGWFFQNHSARIASERHLREVELARAQEIFREISNTMDDLYFCLRHGAIHVAVRKIAEDEEPELGDDKTWSMFEEARFSWMRNRTRFAAETRRYFGDHAHQRLEKISRTFDKAGTLTIATYYDKAESIVKDGETNFRKYYRTVTPLEKQLYELSEQMLHEIQHQNVGQLRPPRGSLKESDGSGQDPPTGPAP